MNMFGKFKTYFISTPKQLCQSEQAHNCLVQNSLQPHSKSSCSACQNNSQQKQSKQQPSIRKKSTDSFELILQDIISDFPTKATNITESSDCLQKKQNEKQNSEKGQQSSPPNQIPNRVQDSDKFQNLQLQDYQEEYEQPQQQIHNMYVTGIIFISKYSEGRQITISEWNEMIQKQNLSLQSQKNIYFSILKGIHFSVRMRVWDLLANTSQMKKLAQEKPYCQLIKEDLVENRDELTIIDKDVPRSVNITSKYLKQLRNMLIGYVNLTGRSYTQGMNLIAGSLLEMLSFQNDSQLNEFGIMESEQSSFEQRAFWVFVGVMRYRSWEHVFEHDLSGLKEMLCRLEKLMVDYTPSVYQKIIDYDWDLTIFSQYYITILLYNTPREFATIVLDLFLLDGENVIHSLIIRMLKLNEDRIMGIMDEGELMMFFKKQMLQETFENLQKDKLNAKKLEDFQINFIESAGL